MNKVTAEILGNWLYQKFVENGLYTVNYALRKDIANKIAKEFLEAYKLSSLSDEDLEPSKADNDYAMMQACDFAEWMNKNVVDYLLDANKFRHDGLEYTAQELYEGPFLHSQDVKFDVEEFEEEDFFYDDSSCQSCGMIEGHLKGCPEDDSPFALLCRRGFD
jgi:hypothetical protein